jgi:hypothetical protein
VDPQTRLELQRQRLTAGVIGGALAASTVVYAGIVEWMLFRPALRPPPTLPIETLTVLRYAFVGLGICSFTPSP